MKIKLPFHRKKDDGNKTILYNDRLYKYVKDLKVSTYGTVSYYEPYMMDINTDEIVIVPANVFLRLLIDLTKYQKIVNICLNRMEDKDD